jgi:tRNA1(Val) A37 N6-methylase TrmN6
MSETSSANPQAGGIVRPARRPEGWVAPGPRPRTPGRPEVWPGQGEDLCYLAGDFRILQRVDGHRWSADDLVTAWYATTHVAKNPPRRAVDLGCGIGTVLLFVAWRFPEANVTGVEAQEISAGLARRSLAWNGIDDRTSVRFGDLRDPETTAGLAPADLVTGTPPYLPIGTGIESTKVQCGPCRFEWRGGVEDYALAAARLLSDEAPFVGCAASRQRPRIVDAAARSGLVLEHFRDVVPREGKDPLFCVYVMRRPGAAQPEEKEEAPLVLRGKDGRFTAEFDDIRRAMGIPVMDGPRGAR